MKTRKQKRDSARKRGGWNVRGTVETPDGSGEVLSVTARRHSGRNRVVRVQLLGGGVRHYSQTVVLDLNPQLTEQS